MRGGHRHAKDFVEQPVMDDHSDEGPGGQQRIDLAEGAFADSHLDIGGKVVVKNGGMLSEKHLGQPMTLERAEKQQPQKGGVHIGSDAEAGDQGEDATVIPFLCGFFDGAEELVYLYL